MAWFRGLCYSPPASVAGLCATGPAVPDEWTQVDKEPTDASDCLTLVVRPVRYQSLPVRVCDNEEDEFCAWDYGTS